MIESRSISAISLVGSISAIPLQLVHLIQLVGTRAGHFSVLLGISFSTFLDCSRAFLKAYLCKLIPVDLFGVFS